MSHFVANITIKILKMRFFLLSALVALSLENCVGLGCTNDQVKVVMTSILQLMDNLEKTDKCSTTSVSCDKCNSDPIIAFSVTLTKHTYIKADDVVVYDKITTNLGSSYNGNTGIFTAPVKGLYHFTSTIMAANKRDLHVKLYKNAEMISVGHAANGVSIMGSMTSAILLQKDDTISVRHDSNKGSQMIYGQQYCSFTGYLIRQM